MTSKLQSTFSWGAFFKSNALLFAIVFGVATAFIGHALPLSETFCRAVRTTVSLVQPVLIFLMLLLTFCKMSFAELRPGRLHFELLAVQGGGFLLCVALSACPFFSDPFLNLLWQSAAILFICPTGTATAVVTSRLGGSAEFVASYTLLANLLTSLLLPLFVPVLHPSGHAEFFPSFFSVLGKVFPLLLLPLLSAWLLQLRSPRLCSRLISVPGLPFRLWCLTLALSVAVTVSNVLNERVGIGVLCAVGVVSLLACAAQFALGRWVGARRRRPITCSQSMGQKNTVFAIWASTFLLNPISALAPGFYCVWHNLYNTWQLKHVDKISPDDK